MRMRKEAQAEEAQRWNRREANKATLRVEAAQADSSRRSPCRTVVVPQEPILIVIVFVGAV